jgi:hypothetical protein
MQLLRKPQNKIIRIEPAAKNGCLSMFGQADIAAE